MKLDLASTFGFSGGLGAKAMARALGAERLKVATPSEPVARALEAAGHEVTRAPLAHGRLPLDDASVDALCLSGLPDSPGLLAECARVIRPGGRLLVATAAGLARRGPDRARVSAALLHAGLVDLEQRMARGVVISSGRVRR